MTDADEENTPEAEAKARAEEENTPEMKARRRQLARRHPTPIVSDPNVAGGYKPDINRKLIGQFEGAYNHFNAELFGGKLPECLIMLEEIPARKTGITFGLYSYKRFYHRDTKQRCDGITLNSLLLFRKNPLDTLATLTHEMVHCWQWNFGKESRSGYHNTQWADHMEQIGLMPSDTGLPGGKRIGQNCTHYVIKRGRFEKVARKLIANGFDPEWNALPRVRKGRGGSGGSGGGGSSGTRTAYICRGCKAKAWGKSSLNLRCDDCNVSMGPASS